MWTPKRFLLLVLGMVFFTTAYGVYAYFLGAVDGLPALPEDMLAKRGEGDTGPIHHLEPDVDRKLKLAFGDDCPELRRTIKLDVRARGMVLAADQFTIVSGGPRDGQVELKPFSVATFGKSKGDGEFPEINTVRSDVAYLTFDQPITTAAEMGTHKVVGGELVSQINDEGPEPSRIGAVGGVRIVNNRRSPQRDDDLTLFTPGPVFYQEAIHKIWTQESIRLIDEQSKPKPTRVDAVGMDVYLLTEDEEPADKSGKKPEKPAHAERPPKPGKNKPDATARKGDKPGNITGIKGILLRSNVDMYLFVEGNSSFMAGPTRTPPPKTKTDKGTTTATAAKTTEPQAPKDPVHIHTEGPFFYDSLNERARFDIAQHPGPRPNHVEVIRTHEANGGGTDQLDCDHLELQMAHKSATPKQGKTASPTAAPAESSDAGDLEIESAHAWGDEVILTSDGENLNAYGQDLVHNTRTRESVLKGGPDSDMTAMKDGNEITARQLVLMGTAPADKDPKTPPPDKETQQARAIGPGIVKMLNKQTGKRNQQARFKDELLVSKDGKYDLLTLVGEASFEDLENARWLKGEKLKVWLEPGEQGQPAKPATPPAPGKAEDSPAQRRRPHHLEAIGRVSAWSPGEMNVHDSDRLVVFFEDAPPTATASAVPAEAPVAPAPGASVVAEKPNTEMAPAAPLPTDPAPAAPTTPPSATSATAPAAPAKAPADKPKQPIDLRARYIEAHVRRCGEKNDLERLWCEGDVRAKQEPSEPGEEGSDIRGETMQLFVFPEGHVLAVTGDLAEVKLGKLNIIGPEVNIDQKENKAWVNGIGSMRMPSDTSLTSGEKLTTPTELTVYWNRDMFFNGKYALFHGGVQAEQNSGRLACQTMQVYLDRFVSLKGQTPNQSPTEKKKDGTPPAKVQKLVCDKSVRVEDRKIDEKTGKMIGFQRIVGPVISLDNEENIIIAPGFGEVRLMQLGEKDQSAQGPGAPAPPPPPANAKPGEQEMKLTQVTYMGRMFANNNTRTAIFYDTVEVINVPSEDPNMVLKPDKLPEGGLWLKCDLLKVFNKRDAGGQGQAHQVMEAHGKAVVRSAAFWGLADVIKYDESKELVVFESGEGHLSRLYKIETPGAQPKELSGKKIYYWRRTGAFRIEGGETIDIPTYDTTPKRTTGTSTAPPSLMPGRP